MWLFTGRYSHLGPGICLIALAVASISAIFISSAARLVQRRDLKAANVVNLLLAAIPAAILGQAEGFGEPVFVSDGLNGGEALFLAIAGVLLGFGGLILSNKLRLLRVLILIVASAILFGDIAGWIRRSAGPSKYISSAGFLMPPETGSPGELAKSHGRKTPKSPTVPVPVRKLGRCFGPEHSPHIQEPASRS